MSEVNDDILALILHPIQITDMMVNVAKYNTYNNEEKRERMKRGLAVMNTPKRPTEKLEMEVSNCLKRSLVMERPNRVTSQGIVTVFILYDGPVYGYLISIVNPVTIVSFTLLLLTNI